MREILFKAKRIDNGEWVEGYLFETEENSYIAYNKQFDDDLFLSPQNIFIAVDENTICQYTGLTDKNGNKIWENDVCNCIYDGRLSIRVIIWDKDELDFKGTNGKKNYGKEFDYLGCCEEIEVISNIFDNPKLIGE